MTENNKKNILLVLIFVGLLFLAWFLPSNFNTYIFRQNGDRMDNPMFDLAIDKLTKLTITKSDGQKIEIIKDENNLWWLTEDGKRLPANFSLIRQMIEAAAKPDKLSIISTNKEFRSRFDLDEANRQEIIYTFADKQVKTYLGKIGRDYQSSYMMFDLDGPVVLMPVDRLTLLPSDLVLYNPYADLSLSLDDLKAIEATVSGQIFKLDKKDDKWLWEEKAIDTVKLDAWLTNALSQKANKPELIDPKWSKQVSIIIKLTKTDGGFIEIKVIKAKKQFGLYRSDIWGDFVWPLNQNQAETYQITPSKWLVESQKSD